MLYVLSVLFPCHMFAPQAFTKCQLYVCWIQEGRWPLGSLSLESSWMETQILPDCPPMRNSGSLGFLLSATGTHTGFSLQGELAIL